VSLEKRITRTDDERFLNSYHNASTPPGLDVPPELAAIMLSADPVPSQGARLGVRARSSGRRSAPHRRGMGICRQELLASEKFAAWADYRPYVHSSRTASAPAKRGPSTVG
jgi:hypothetical protein